jgi:hypothetical protein
MKADSCCNLISSWFPDFVCLSRADYYVIIYNCNVIWSCHCPKNLLAKHCSRIRKKLFLNFFWAHAVSWTDVMISKIFSLKNLAKKLSFLTQNKATFYNNLIITFVFKKNANFFRRKLGKIVENCDHNINPWPSKIYTWSFFLPTSFFPSSFRPRKKRNLEKIGLHWKAIARFYTPSKKSTA